jgi:hypothetical protein
MCSIKSFQDGNGVVRVSYPQETLMTVILVCPKCHTRMELDYDVWVVSEIPGTPAHKQFLCKNILCEGKKMIYHKMGNE